MERNPLQAPPLDRLKDLFGLSGVEGNYGDPAVLRSIQLQRGRIDLKYDSYPRAAQRLSVRVHKSDHPSVEFYLTPEGLTAVSVAGELKVGEGTLKVGSLIIKQEDVAVEDLEQFQEAEFVTQWFEEIMKKGKVTKAPFNIVPSLG